MFLLALAAGYAGWAGVDAVRYRRAVAAAEAALAAYDFPAARAAAEAALAVRPADGPARLLAAQAARRAGDLPAAAAHLDKVPPADPRLPVEQAMLAAQRGRPQQAVDFLLARVDAGDPATEAILEALAVGWVQVYRYDRGGFFNRELLDRFPRNPVGRFLSAQVADTFGNREAAGRLCRELLADFPAHAPARLLLAGVLFREQKYDEAEAAYREYAAAAPADPAGPLGRAECLTRLGRTEAAADAVRAAAAAFPDHPRAVLAAGRAALQTGQLGEAERLLRRAVELAPADNESHLLLAGCYTQLGRPAEADRELAAAHRIEADLTRLEQLVDQVMKAPQDPAPRVEAGQICLRNGQDAEGLRWLFGVLEADPAHRPAHDALAAHFAAKGDTRRAEYHRRGGR